MTPEEAMRDALNKHPDCSYADWEPGINSALQLTIVVKLWRDEECWSYNDPPKYEVEGYIR